MSVFSGSQPKSWLVNDGDHWLRDDGIMTRVDGVWRWPEGDRRDTIMSSTISANALKGSVFIAPRNPVAGFQNLGYIVEDERDTQYRKWGDDRPLPRRNILDGASIEFKLDGVNPQVLALLTGTAITPKKESTVIDKKNFEKYTYRTNADDLSGRHIGALVKVKTSDGVEITDVLTGVQAGEYIKNQGAGAGKVLVTLKHYKTYYGELAGVLLDGSSAVTVRHAIVEVSA